jgi:ferredoxin
MSKVTFLGPPLYDQFVVHIAPPGRSSLLNLARKLRLSLRNRCREGVCGACAVKVAVLHRQSGSQTVRLSAEEKTVLYQAGKLTREQYESEGLADNPPLWRLACQYVVQEEDILVAI